MRVLVVGASGFIGRRIVGYLADAGHEVVAAVRRVAETRRIFPGLAVVPCDLRVDTTVESWAGRLLGIEAVVNAAGVLQDQAARQIHVDGPRALYAACAAAGIRRVVHISAVSADAAAGTGYAETKLAGEVALRALALDWVILRPSLIYGEGSYGGTSLLRALAAFPGCIPLPGAGDQPFQPLHIDDLCRTVAAALTERRLAKTVINPVGPDRLSLAEIVRKWRGWLGLAPVPPLSVPLWLVAAAAKLGDVIPLGPINSTAFRQLIYGNTAPFDAYAAAIDFAPVGFDHALRRRAANVQDRWHARLFWLRLLLRFGLAAFWIISGAVGLAVGAIGGSAFMAGLAAATGVSESVLTVLAMLGSCVDILIGIALVFGWRPRWTGIAQLILIVGYPILFTAVTPHLLLDPLGSLVKNLPLLLAVLASMALADDW
jgi:uncharacterized protein YbjT (DUF2867 family)